MYVGSFASAMYYIFYCHENLMKMYIGAMSCICFITGCIVSHPYFNTFELRWFRFGVYFATSAFFVVPYVHIILYHFQSHWKWIDFHYYIISEIIFYSIGGVVFASRFPERYTSKLGKYDLIGASHQIWHLCVLIG